MSVLGRHMVFDRVLLALIALHGLVTVHASPTLAFGMPAGECFCQASV
jgi:hypothetical protein